LVRVRSREASLSGGGLLRPADAGEGRSRVSSFCARAAVDESTRARMINAVRRIRSSYPRVTRSGRAGCHQRGPRNEPLLIGRPDVVLLDRRDGLLADPDRSEPETAAATAAITATPTAAAPPGAASAASAAVSAAAAPSSAVAATAVPTLGGELYSGRMCSGVFLVEDIEGRQADVENLFLTERHYMTRCSVLSRHVFCGIDDCRGCAAPQR
jgi:hypothetical protein